MGGFFSGKSGSQSKSSGSKSSKSSIQKQINAEQARIGKGNWNQKLNDLVKQRDNAGSGSSGLAGLGTALRNAPKNIARDVKMGFNPSSRDADYYRRTADTIARTQGKTAADRYINQMTNKGGLAAAGVKNADVSGSVNYGQRIGMLNQDGGVNTRYGRGDRGGSNVVTPAPEDVQSPAEQAQANQAMLNRMRMMQGQDTRARNMDMARMMFERQNMRSPGPMPRQMQGIGGFRRQPPPGMNERMMSQSSRYYGGQPQVNPYTQAGQRPSMYPGSYGQPQSQRQPPPGMYERMMRQGPRQYGGQAQQVSQADFGGIQQRPMPSDRTPRGGFGSSGQPASQQEMTQKLQGMRGGMRPAVMPRMPQPMPRNQASSPAFRYAAQNYDRLGGMQRTMPRPMEMMSRAERQQIGRIADSFQPQPMQNPYVGILQRGISAKGGGRTMPQRPPMSGKGGGRTGSQVPSALFGYANRVF